jgi:hypothetical protein
LLLNLWVVDVQRYKNSFQFGLGVHAVGAARRSDKQKRDAAIGQQQMIAVFGQSLGVGFGRIEAAPGQQVT